MNSLTDLGELIFGLIEPEPTFIYETEISGLKVHSFSFSLSLLSGSNRAYRLAECSLFSEYSLSCICDDEELIARLVRKLLLLAILEFMAKLFR